MADEAPAVVRLTVPVEADGPPAAMTVVSDVFVEAIIIVGELLPENTISFICRRKPLHVERTRISQSLWQRNLQSLHLRPKNICLQHWSQVAISLNFL